MTGAEFGSAVNPGATTPTTPMDPEERRQQEEEWRAELTKVRVCGAVCVRVVPAKICVCGT